MNHAIGLNWYSAASALAALGVAATALASDNSANNGKTDARLGEEVDRICFRRDIDGFRTIQDEDDAVLLERGVNDWYKTTLSGPCNYSTLRFAQSVAIDGRPQGGCVTRGDALVFSDSAFGDFSFPRATRCIIVEIHRWDPKAEAPDEPDSGAEAESPVDRP